MRKLSRRSRCPINFTLELFGDTWSLLIVRDLMFYGKRYYSDFLNSEEGIATNILAQRLSLLEGNKIIRRTPDPKDRRKDVYTLTQKGIELAPVLIELIVWGAKYDPYTATPPSFVVEAKRNRNGVIRKIKTRLKTSERQIQNFRPQTT